MHSVRSSILRLAAIDLASRSVDIYLGGFVCFSVGRGVCCMAACPVYRSWLFCRRE